ncbi:MAG: MoaD/ThiS family protein [Candidatus Schekmanbacteria bacterium]|nr:MoaD/ThiS family protein [Candidatus Schekmanbacteria bacterium]
MAVKVRIPTPLRKLTSQQAIVDAEGKNVAEVIDDLEKKYSGIKGRLCDDDGKIRRFVNIFVNEEDIRFLNGTETAVKEGDELSIVPAIAGG